MQRKREEEREFILTSSSLKASKISFMNETRKTERKEMLKRHTKERVR